ncbi:hypothetical protein CCYA_CCYA14G3797 [Cyanidiococcus yangmingshanensis]|nr:hypothetical protein CCYA_CCYA14G3797 [Cyanidiococcus yangmingshanensis]
MSSDFPPLPDVCGVAAFSQGVRHTSNPDHTIFVSGLCLEAPTTPGDGLPTETAFLERLLAELFTQLAPVRRVSVPRDRITGRPLGNYAFVEFYEAKDASFAAAVTNGIFFRGQALQTRGPDLLPSLEGSQSEVKSQERVSN